MYPYVASMLPQKPLPCHSLQLTTYKFKARSKLLRKLSALLGRDKVVGTWKGYGNCSSAGAIILGPRTCFSNGVCHVVCAGLELWGAAENSHSSEGPGNEQRAPVQLP